jgi:hypothetical protein
MRRATFDRHVQLRPRHHSPPSRPLPNAEHRLPGGTEMFFVLKTCVTFVGGL